MGIGDEQAKKLDCPQILLDEAQLLLANWPQD